MAGATVGDAVARQLVAELRAWSPVDAGQRETLGRYLAFVGERGAALARDGGPEHVTASCFVFTPDRTRVLLCFHKKGGFWVQLGGHIEATDASVPAAALREAREEGGIAELAPLRQTPVDLDRHGLGAGFRCRAHWDIGYAATAAADSVPVTSEESEDVAWWPIDALPANIPPGFAERLAGVLREIAATD